MSVIAGPPPPRPSEVRWFGKNPDPFVHAALTSVRDTLTGATQQRQRFAAIVRDESEASYRAYVGRCHRTGDAVTYATAAA